MSLSLGKDGINSTVDIAQSIDSSTFSRQAEWRIEAIEDGRVLHRGKRTRIRPATIGGYRSAIEWMSPHIGNMPLANIKNAAAKELVTAMKQAELSDKTIVNYIHVLQSVIASVVSGEGEQVHPRTWDSHFIRLPVVNPKKQNRPTRTAKEIEQIVAAVTGRYRVLYALLAGSGLRIGEALSIKIGPMSDDCSTISGECSTIYVSAGCVARERARPENTSSRSGCGHSKGTHSLAVGICGRPQGRVSVLLGKRQAPITTQSPSRQPASCASQTQATESGFPLLSTLP